MNSDGTLGFAGGQSITVRTRVLGPPQSEASLGMSGRIGAPAARELDAGLACPPSSPSSTAWAWTPYVLRLSHSYAEPAEPGHDHGAHQAGTVGPPRAWTRAGMGLWVPRRLFGHRALGQRECAAVLGYTFTAPSAILEYRPARDGVGSGAWWFSGSPRSCERRQTALQLMADHRQSIRNDAACRPTPRGRPGSCSAPSPPAARI